MKLTKAVFYQAVKLPVKGQANFNTVNNEAVNGVKMELLDQLVFVDHDEWSEKVIVPTANLRYAEIDKVKILEARINVPDNITIVKENDITMERLNDLKVFTSTVLKEDLKKNKKNAKSSK